MAISGAVSATYFPENDGDAGGDGNNNHVTRTRWPRSIPGIGSSAVRLLMQGTKQMDTRSTIYRKYFKQGTKNDAISDFRNLNPEVTRSRSYGAIGFRGGLKIKLTFNDKTNHWLPTMKISHPDMDKSIKIVYINKKID